MVTIHTHTAANGDHYTVDSLGNGWAYEFCLRAADGRLLSLFVQDDEARDFEAALHGVFAMDERPQGCAALPYLWDQCGWGEAARNYSTEER